MLDPKATFDRIVADEAADEAQRNRVLENEFYRHMSSGLSGTQEYMAVETLHQLVHDDRFDLVVVDTPPITASPRRRRRPRASSPCSTTASTAS